MTFREFVDNCNKLLAEKPETATFEVVTASDDEGNYFNKIHYQPSVGILDGHEFLTPDCDDDDSKFNAVCVN